MNQNDIFEEQNMLRGITRFNEETVKEVMTSRPDIVVLELNTPFTQTIHCFIKNGYSHVQKIKVCITPPTSKNLKNVDTCLST